MSRTFALYLMRFRFAFALVSLLAIAVAAVGITNIGFNGDFKVMFAEDNPDLVRLDNIEQTYVQSDQMLVLIKPASGDVFSRPSLVLVEELTERLWQTPYSVRVDSLTSYNRSHSNNDVFYVEPLIEDAATLSDAEIEELRGYAQQDAYLSKGLVSADMQVTSIVINLALPEDSLTRLPAMQDLLDFLESVKSDVQAQYPNTVIHFMGGPSLEISMVNVIYTDMQTLLPICFFIVFILLGVLLRSFISVAGTLFTIAMTLLLTMGIVGWLGFELSPTSVTAPIMVVLLAMADSVHLLTQYILEYRKGHNKFKAMELSIEMNIRPIFLTSITTAIGFLGLNMSDSPAFHDFGTITFIGVLIAFVLTLTLTPTVVLFLPVKIVQKPLPLSNMMSMISGFVVAKQRPLFWCVLIAVPIVVSYIPKLSINDDIVEYLTDDVPFKQTVAFANEHLSGFQYVLYSLDSGQEGYVNDPEFLNTVDQFQRWLRQQPGVSHVHSYVDILKSINSAMHNDDALFNKIPESRELAAQYMLLYEMSLPAGNDLTRDLDNARSSLRIMVSLNTLPNHQLIELDKNAQQWLRDNAPALASAGGSRSLMFANLGVAVAKSMVAGSLIALGLISLVIIIGLGSLRFGLLAIIPNVIPAAVVFGAWAILVGEVNQTASVVFSMSLGLVVDDTVHFLTKYLQARQRGVSPARSVEYSFRTAGVALFVTTVALSIGMLTNVFSSFIPNITTALMLAAILSFALILDLFFLAPLLLHFERFYEKIRGKSLVAVAN